MVPLSSLIEVYWLTEFRVEVVAVVVVFHILRGMRGNASKAQDCSCFPLTYPQMGFVWLSGLFVCLFVQNFRKGLSAYVVLTWLCSHICCRADSDSDCLLSVTFAGLSYDF